ncbi:MAG: hypothetical protein ACLFN8_00665 [Candidatus Woesearchaeota archaeon]
MNQNQNPQQPNTNNFPHAQNTWAKPQTDEVSKSLSEIASSIRILEDRYMNLRRKSQITDQNLIELQKEYFKEKKHMNQELLETKIKLQELIEDLKIMHTELKDTAKQKDITVLNSYLDMWEPIQFVTRAEIEKLIKDKSI